MHPNGFILIYKLCLSKVFKMLKIKKKNAVKPLASVPPHRQGPLLY
jgi:hypothetical protein